MADIRQMWRELIVKPESEVVPEALHLVEELRSVYVNGGAEFRSFRFDLHPTLAWFMETRRLTLPSFDFSSGFVTLDVVRASLPMLDIPAELAQSLLVEELDVFELEANVSRSLVFGGAYESVSRPRREAQAVVADFVDTLSPDMTHGWFAISHVPWTAWFFDVAWDHTWLGLDLLQQRVWILCATDTD